MTPQDFKTSSFQRSKHLVVCSRRALNQYWLTWSAVKRLLPR